MGDWGGEGRKGEGRSASEFPSPHFATASRLLPPPFFASLKGGPLSEDRLPEPKWGVSDAAHMLMVVGEMVARVAERPSNQGSFSLRPNQGKKEGPLPLPPTADAPTAFKAASHNAPSSSSRENHPIGLPT